jgi:hypothetical protein
MDEEYYIDGIKDFLKSCGLENIEDATTYETSDWEVIKKIFETAKNQKMELSYCKDGDQDIIEAMYFGKDLEEKKFCDQERVKKLYSNLKIPNLTKGKNITIETNGGGKNSNVIGHNINSQINSTKGLEMLKENLSQNEEKSQLMEDIIDILVLKGKMRSKNDNYTINLDAFLDVSYQVIKQLKHEKYISKNSAMANKIPYNKDYLNCVYAKDRKLIKKYSPTKGLVDILEKRDRNRSAKTNLGRW